MAITFEEQPEGTFRLRFDAVEGFLPALEYSLLAHVVHPGSGKLLAGVWQATKVPYVADDLGYYLSEGKASPGASDYAYWHYQGLAGCILRPHLRQRLGLSRANTDILTQLFTHPTL